MENVRKSAGYAESQIRSLLSDLGNSSNAVRVKAVKNFQNYIEHSIPEIYDDDIDFLYTGYNSEFGKYTTNGLLYYSGMRSEKHDGQLKRICGPCVSLVKWLITFKGYTEETGGNPFYDRLVQLNVSELMKINFPKHIIQLPDKDSILNVKTITGESRSGSSEDAMEILSFLIRDHRGLNEESTAFDLVDKLLEKSKVCRDKFKKWLERGDIEQKSQEFSFDSPGVTKVARAIRPKTWNALELHAVPKQEYEEDEVEDEDEEITDDITPVPDPLGIQDIDLRLEQNNRVLEATLSKSGVLGRNTHLRDRRATNALDKMAIMAKVEAIDKGDHVSEHQALKLADEDGDDEVKEAELESLLPSEKSFNAILFLTYVHRDTKFKELDKGSQNLEIILQEQGMKRIRIVNNHFGLFVLCAHGLEWLKMERKNSGVDEQLGSIGVHINRAQSYLNTAKFEAQSALQPLLFRHRKSMGIKKAEQDLKNISSVVEFPEKMQAAFDANSYEEVVAIYARVVKLSMQSTGDGNSSTGLIIDRIKGKADAIMEELKGRCESAMQQQGKVPDTENIKWYWRVLCSFDDVTKSDSTDIDPSSHLQYLRSSFDNHVGYFTDMFRKLFDELKVSGAQALINGEGMSVSMTKVSSSSALPSDNVMQKKPHEELESQQLFEEFMDVERGDENEDDYGEDAEYDLDEFGEKSIDYSKRLSSDLRVDVLKRIVDIFAEWVPSLHKLGQLVTQETQKVANTGKRAGMKTPATTVFAKELMKIASFCSCLLKGISEPCLVFGKIEGALTHPHFSSQLSFRYAADAYNEIFAIYEQVNSLTAVSIDDIVTPVKGTPASILKPMYVEALTLLKEITIEGELIAAAALMKTLDQKLSASLAILDGAVSHLVPERSRVSLQAVPKSDHFGEISRAGVDFETLTLITLSKLYGESNRPEWIIDVVKDGLIKELNKLIDSLKKAVLVKNIESSQSFEQHLESSSELDLEGIRGLLDEADNTQEARSYRRMFETIRVCLYLRIYAIPKISGEIKVSRDAENIDSSSHHTRRESFSSGDMAKAAKILSTLTEELNAAVLELEALVAVRYLELKSWSMRSRLSALYLNQLVDYANFTTRSSALPLTTMLLLLAEEKSHIHFSFSLGLQSFLPDQESGGKKAVAIFGYGHVLFIELCKQMASFYVDLVTGLYTGSVMHVLDIKPNAGVTLPIWNKKQIVARRGSEHDKFGLNLPKAATRNKANPIMPACPWPKLFDRTLIEANYFADLTQQMLDRAAGYSNEFALHSIPTAQVQVRVDVEAFYGHTVSKASSAQDSALLDEQLSSLSLLLI